MGVEFIVATLVSVAGVLGGYMKGKRDSRSAEMAIATNTVELLQAAIDQLKEQVEAKDVLIAELYGRVQTLEGLVTQRADVDAVHEEVKAVKVVVDRIAESIGA